MNIKFAGVVAVVLAAFIGMSTFVVHEREVAVKFKLGEIVSVITEPGLYFKIPVLNNVRFFDARILTLDTPAQRFLTSEKKNVIVDSFIKWRITDAGTFYTSTQGDERIAITRLIQIINDQMKGQVGSRTIKEVVSGERNDIMSTVLTNADAEAKNLGVDIVDVRIKRVDLPENVSDSVYQRMAKERETVAKSFRSRGEEQAKGIRANADRQREEILAEAYRKAQEINGSGDAEAAETYAKAYNDDRDFYAFYRSLNAYRNTFSGNNDVMILSPDSDFFRYFKDVGR